MLRVRRDYKSTLFCHLFGSEDRKGYALELYNALAGSAYEDPDELEIVTIDNTVYLGRKNDVSYLVGDEMALVEHQSTLNPNMPLRGLLYFSRLMTRLVERRNLDLFGERPVQLPTPRYVVCYFGTRDLPDREVLRLSDLYTSGPGDVEVTALVLNCNEGRNRVIMEACAALRGYAHLVALERDFRSSGMSYRDAARMGIDQCIEDGFLVGYLTEHRAEAEDMLFTVQDEERAMRVHREAIEREARKAGMEQGLEQGLEQGKAQGMEQGMAQGMAQGMNALGDKLAASGVDKDLIISAIKELQATDGADE